LATLQLQGYKANLSYSKPSLYSKFVNQNQYKLDDMSKIQHHETQNCYKFWFSLLTRRRCSAFNLLTQHLLIPRQTLVSLILLILLGTTSTTNLTCGAASNMVKFFWRCSSSSSIAATLPHLQQ